MKTYSVLLIGSGGREHAIAWKLSQSELLKQLYTSPGNPGTAMHGSNVDLDIQDFNEILNFINKNEVDIVIVGPEDPLVNGIADFLNQNLPNCIVIGPSAEGAQLEGSKDFAKQFMLEYGIPTAQHATFSREQHSEAIAYIQNMETPIVIKADGLAAGKGVYIVDTHREAEDVLKEMYAGKFGDASQTVVIEEFLSGIEFSVFVLTDGVDYVTLPEAKDYKRIGENDTGLNTGGMGSVSPVSFLTDELRKKVDSEIIQPTIAGLKSRKIDYKGFIFFGLMKVEDEVYVIEYNVRMGDPETQTVMSRLENDLLELCIACGDGNLRQLPIHHLKDHVVTTVLVSGGYPESYEKGYEIQLPETTDHITIFHAGTTVKDGTLVTAGGRVLAVTSRESSLAKAISQSQKVAENTHFANSYFRKDIGNDLL